MQSLNLEFNFDVPRKVIYEALTDQMYLWKLFQENHAIYKSKG